MTSMSHERNNTNHSNQEHEGSDQSPDRGKSLTLEYGKSIKLLRNGDEFYAGQKVVINSRKYRYFDVFLDDLSNTINARFGAVRAIHTPLHGHKIKSLDQIEDGKVYVAAGAGKFKKMNYLDIAQGRKPKPARLPALNRTPPQLSNVQSRPLFEKSGNLFIYVYKNGDVLTPPVKVLLYKHQLTKFEAVLNEVTDKVQLPNGAVLRLFTMEGDEITTTQQLLNGHAYVATNKDKFKRCEYFSPEDFGVSPRMLRKVNSQPTSYNGSTASTSGKSAFSYSGKPYTGWHPSRDELGGHKPVRALRNPPPTTKQINVDKDDSGLYKARGNKHSREAREIPDNDHMLVDMPVDMREANEIDDEEIGELNHNARQKQRDKSQNRKPHFEPYVDDEKPPTPPSKNQKQLTNSKKADQHGAVITDKSDSPINYNASTSHTYNQDDRSHDNATATSYHENHTNDDYDSQHHQKSDPYDSRHDQYDDENKHQSTRTQDHHSRNDNDDDYQMYNNNNRNHSNNDNHKTINNHHNDTYNYDDQHDDHHTNNNRTFTEDDRNTDRHNDTTTTPYVDHNATTNNKSSTKNYRTKNDLNEEQAATIIQASYRGYKTRQDFKQGKYKKPNYQENSNDNNNAEIAEISAVSVINQDPITSTSTSNLNAIHKLVFDESAEELIPVDGDSDTDENIEINKEVQTKYLPEEI